MAQNDARYLVRLNSFGPPRYWLLFLLHEVYNLKPLTLWSTLPIDGTEAVGIEVRESSGAGRDTWGGVWDLAVFRRVSVVARLSRLLEVRKV